MSNLRDHYENDEVWSEEKYIGNSEELKRFEETINSIGDNCFTLLDVGSGNGAFLKILEEKKKELKLLGLELTEAGIRNKICLSEIQQGSVDGLPFKDNEFDIVTALEVIEHLPYSIYRTALCEIARVAKEKIVVSVPYQEDRINVRCPKCSCEFNPNTHVRSFYDVTFNELFEGFNLVKLKRVGKNKRFFLKGSIVNELRRIIARNQFPTNLFCPQCNYSSPGGSNNSRGSKVIKRNNQFKTYFFKGDYKWYIAEYEVDSSTGT
jgi:ubiquinone/menaquinone biosynthesis C-methylase UbiE